MFKTKSIFLALALTLVVGGLVAATHETSGEVKGDAGLVGAWLVSASRPGGQGVVLLTFNADGTFYRSGDTHPLMSVAHGAWKRAGNQQFDGNYVALRFDDSKKLVGTQKTHVHITQSDENTFSGVAKVSILDLEGKETKTSETQLAGKRILAD